jgi:hypothetical protein
MIKQDQAKNNVMTGSKDQLTVPTEPVAISDNTIRDLNQQVMHFQVTQVYHDRPIGRPPALDSCNGEPPKINSIIDAVD